MTPDEEAWVTDKPVRLTGRLGSPSSRSSGKADHHMGMSLRNREGFTRPCLRGHPAAERARALRHGAETDAGCAQQADGALGGQPRSA